MTGPIEVDVNPDHTVARVAIPLKGNGTDSTSLAALHTLRDDVLPATIGKVPGVTYAVTGGTAASADENALLKHSAPLVFGFVLTFAFLLLLVSFRSLVIAAKAIVLNLLSVARRLRRARGRLPVGLGREPAELPLQRRHRAVAADLHVRDPVRPLDGLPRLHPEPDPRGVRPGHRRPRTRSPTGSRPRPASSRAPRS